MSAADLPVFSHAQRGYRYLPIRRVAAGLGSDVEQMPFAIRILFENAARHRHLKGAGAIEEREIGAIAQWRDTVVASITLHVERVMLPDSSGLPTLQDLAAVRDAVARRGGAPQDVQSRIPVDLVVDHSLIVDRAGDASALTFNLKREFERNGERYRFLRWTENAFGLRIFPPGSGIIHQINLEHVAPVVMTGRQDGLTLAFPDFVTGSDSHTPMINGIGVLGWGVGGIEAATAILGRGYTIPLPEVVGVRLTGEIPAGRMTMDVALTVTERLRKEGVVGSMVEYFGAEAAALSIPERATLANMAPEYGATVGYFPIDARTIDYIALTRSPGHAAFVEAYSRANDLFRVDAVAERGYGRVIDIDLSRVSVSISGPGRPHDRMDLEYAAADLARRLPLPLTEGGFNAAGEAFVALGDRTVGHGMVAIAAITSCTNTSNPTAMLTAGLLARNARARGLSMPPWVKTSLAPGSRVVTRYLQDAGLLEPLEQLGFHVVGYGCTTCGGKSGPLAADVVAAIEGRDLVATAVLSGNRNFEGRIHRLIKANYICSPPLVVAMGLSGHLRDLASEPVGTGTDGQPVYLSDIWPSAEEIAEHERRARSSALFRETYEGSPNIALWNEIDVPDAVRFPWDPGSKYMVEPPFCENAGSAILPDSLLGARALGAFGDSLTTDHISPGGEIPLNSPAGRYLTSLGIAQRDFNTYVARRSNHEVMIRATFANIRIKNLLVPGHEGGVTCHFPGGETMPVHEVADLYRASETPLIVLGGREYGIGSSRDWAAKGTLLLGVRIVIAESFERIHRSNLVALGVLPLRFAEGQGWRQLGLRGDETYDITGLDRGIDEGRPIEISATTAEGEKVHFLAEAALLTRNERSLMQRGGLLPSVVADYTRSENSAVDSAGH